MREQLRRKIGDPHGQTRRAQFCRKNAARFRTKPEPARRAAAGGWPELIIGDQPALDQLEHPLRNHGAPEARLPSHLGPRRGRARAHQIEHHDQRVELLACKGDIEFGGGHV